METMRERLTSARDFANQAQEAMYGRMRSRCADTIPPNYEKATALALVSIAATLVALAEAWGTPTIYSA